MAHWDVYWSIKQHRVMLKKVVEHPITEIPLSSSCPPEAHMCACMNQLVCLITQENQRGNTAPQTFLPSSSQLLSIILLSSVWFDSGTAGVSSRAKEDCGAFGTLEHLDLCSYVIPCRTEKEKKRHRVLAKMNKLWKLWNKLNAAAVVVC